MRVWMWFCALLVAGAAQAYDIEEFLRDARAHHERHLTGMGGLTLDLTGLITQPGHDAVEVAATYTMRGAQWRADATVRNPGQTEGFPFVVLYDGQQTWAQLLGMKLKVPRSDVDDRVRGYLYWEAPAAGSVVAGEETIGGHACWRIETPLRESDGSAVTMKSWYDKQHFVLVQSESSYDKKPVRMEFSDFRAVRGDYVIPHGMRAVQNDVQLVQAQIVAARTGEIDGERFSAASLDGADFPDMNELMRTFKIFGKAFGNEVSKLLQSE